MTLLGGTDTAPRFLQMCFFHAFTVNVFSAFKPCWSSWSFTTLRCEADGGVWPMPKVNRAVNCVWALHHTPTAAEIKRCSSQSFYWQLPSNWTVSLLFSLPSLTWTIKSTEEPDRSLVQSKTSRCKHTFISVCEHSDWHLTLKQQG